VNTNENSSSHSPANAIAGSDDATSQPWAAIWALAVTLFFILTIAAEYGWRAYGYLPSASDSPALWTLWYRYVSCDRQKAIAIIGSSRIQCGVLPAEIQTRLPQYRVAQLGQYGAGSPIGVLRALALDDNFDGIIICDTLMPYLIHTSWTDQRHLYACPAGLRQGLEAFALATLHSRLAIADENTGIKSALKRLVDFADLPALPPVRMKLDRSIVLDFASGPDLIASNAKQVARFRWRYQEGRQPTMEQMRLDFDRIDEYVRRIQSRGGRVVFIRMPSSGARRELEEKYHPRGIYWNAFARASSGVCIHFSDLKVTGELRCPDESHLDQTSATNFTNGLVDELLKQRVCTTW